MSIATDSRKAVGRPAGTDSEKVRSNLMNAARQHFLKSEFKAVSLRQIADSAGVNPAMVKYYFGSKHGLYAAMIEELLSSLEASLEEIGDSDSLTITDFSRSYTQILAENPWWPNFIVREVLFSEEETRETMMSRFSSAFAPRLLASICHDINRGHYRNDLDPAMTMVSIMALTIFPFLARPIMESVLKLDFNEDFVEQLAKHNIALFEQGVLAPAKGGDLT